MSVVSLQLLVQEVSERNRVVIQVMLNVTPLEPRLANGPRPGIRSRRPKDIGRAYLPVCSTIQDVCVDVDVMHRVAGREAEPEEGRLT